MINKNENHNQSVVSKLFEKYEKTFNDNKKHWKEVKISDVAHVEGGTGFPKKYQGLLNEEIHFYKVSDMNHPENQVLMNISQNTISKKNLKILGGKIFESGSIIFPKIGGAIATNKKRLTTVNCCVDNNVMGIIPNKKKIIPEYLYEIFNSVELKKFANDAGYPSITKPKIENFTFLMPIELNKQKEISTLIRQIKSVLNNLINNNNSKIDLLIDLNKKILN